MSDFETEAELNAYYQGHDHGAGEYERELRRRKAGEAILTDLITELRINPFTPTWIADAADRAEARLKEVVGDE